MNKCQRGSKLGSRLDSNGLHSLDQEAALENATGHHRHFFCITFIPGDALKTEVSYKMS